MAVNSPPTSQVARGWGHNYREFIDARTVTDPLSNTDFFYASRGDGSFRSGQWNMDASDDGGGRRRFSNTTDRMDRMTTGDKDFVVTERGSLTKYTFSGIQAENGTRPLKLITDTFNNQVNFQCNGPHLEEVWLGPVLAANDPTARFLDLVYPSDTTKDNLTSIVLKYPLNGVRAT